MTGSFDSCGFFIFDNIENDIINQSQSQEVVLKCQKNGLQDLFMFLNESFAQMQKSQMGMVSKEIWFSEPILADVQFRLNISNGFGIKKCQ